MNRLKQTLKKINWLKAAEIVVVSVMMLAPVLVPLAAHAQVAPPCPAGAVRCGETSLTSLLQTIINYMLAFAGLIAVIFLIWGGFQYITAGGNEETAEKGKGTVVNAIIGLVIIGLSYVIVNVVIGLIKSNNAGVA